MGTIQIRGARTHNLKNIDLDLPRDKLIVITGLSGSGKTSQGYIRSNFWSFWFGKIFFGIRHVIRRRTEEVCRITLYLCQTISFNDGKARC